MIPGFHDHDTPSPPHCHRHHAHHSLHHHDRHCCCPPHHSNYTHQYEISCARHMQFLSLGSPILRTCEQQNKLAEIVRENLLIIQLAGQGPCWSCSQKAGVPGFFLGGGACQKTCLSVCLSFHTASLLGLPHHPFSPYPKCSIYCL